MAFSTIPPPIPGQPGDEYDGSGSLENYETNSNASSQEVGQGLPGSTRKDKSHLGAGAYKQGLDIENRLGGYHVQQEDRNVTTWNTLS